MAPHTQHASLLEKLMPVAYSHRLCSMENERRESDGRYRDCRFTHPQVRERLRVASVFAIKGDSSSFNRNFLRSWYVSGFDSSGAPVRRHRKSINDEFLRHGIAAAESRSRGIVDTFSRVKSASSTYVGHCEILF